MPEKIDVFAHVLLPEFYEKMAELDGHILQKYPFMGHPLLSDMEQRRRHAVKGVKQIISYVNLNPEDYVSGEAAALLCRKANEELLETIKQYPELFAGGVGMLPMNNIAAAIEMLKRDILPNPYLLGVQLFTRHLGKSLADPEFKPLFAALAQLNIPVWLHPVFDGRKPDNNIVFSWEYELSQTMLELVEAGYYQEFPDLKIIVHHAGAMIPYFAGRIEHILPAHLAADFKKFYVDTALLGNSKALELCVDYFGNDHVFFGTDAPLGLAPAGATEEIIKAIDSLPVLQAEKEYIYYGNFERFLKK